MSKTVVGNEPTMEEQVHDLQSRLAFQEDAIQTINKQMSLQAEELAVLKRYIRELNLKIAELKQQGQGGDGGISLYDERPPHY